MLADRRRGELEPIIQRVVLFTILFQWFHAVKMIAVNVTDKIVHISERRIQYKLMFIYKKKDFWDFLSTLFNTALYAAPQIPGCWY